MKLTVLVDNNTLIDRYFVGEPGVSYFIEDEGTRILFDVGYSDVFIANAQKLGIDLTHIDFVVLSHGHLDHTWGLMPLVRLFTECAIEERDAGTPTLVAHPGALAKKRSDDLGEIGSLLSADGLRGNLRLDLTEEPRWLTERLVFLGEIERTHAFEAGVAMGKTVRNGTEVDDFLLDDSALAYMSSDGLVIVTGCSHSGICNITDYARKVCGENKVADIIGGFHLLNPSSEQLQGTVDYLGTLQPGSIHACHCTDLDSKIALAQAVTLKEVGVGLELEY